MNKCFVLHFSLVARVIRRLIQLKTRAYTKTGNEKTMNRSHRIIWNETRKAFVVASEGAKAKGKPSSTRKAVTVAVLGALGALAGMPALAASSCPGGGSLVTISGAETSTCQLNAGGSLTVTSNGSINSSSNGVLVQFVTAGTISNSGMVSGNVGFGIIGSSVGNIGNSGTISGAGNYGVFLNLSTVSGGISNSGTISGVDRGIGFNGSTVIGNITNAAGAIISGGATGFYLNNTNNTGGTISGGTDGIQLNHATVSGGITNSGTISGVNHGIISLSGSEV